MSPADRRRSPRSAGDTARPARTAGRTACGCRAGSFRIHHEDTEVTKKTAHRGRPARMRARGPRSMTGSVFFRVSVVILNHAFRPQPGDRRRVVTEFAQDLLGMLALVG